MPNACLIPARAGLAEAARFAAVLRVIILNARPLVLAPALVADLGRPRGRAATSRQQGAEAFVLPEDRRARRFIRYVGGFDRSPLTVASAGGGGTTLGRRGALPGQPSWIVA
jgi:hypothetical protein